MNVTQMRPYSDTRVAMWEIWLLLMNEQCVHNAQRVGRAARKVLGGPFMIGKKTLAALLSATSLTSVSALMTPVAAQETAPAARPAETVVVTGSRIRRQTFDSSVPLQIITSEDLKRDSVSSPEQLVTNLNVVGNGVDNLASQADVAGPDQRGNNGSSSVNLRGQGSNSTLTLLNGRRLATHGLSSGGAVDVNQIPLSAVQRTEILLDGASAIYGTDAIGGVINFILREDVQGLNLQAFTDIAEQGGGSIYRLGAVGGYGDLATQGFNIMGAVGWRQNEVLYSNERDYIKTHDPARGLSVDTRGTPFGTIFAANGTLFTTATGSRPRVPGTSVVAEAINPLRLPGNLGCAAIDGQLNYDELLWNSPSSALACAYDTGRATVIAQPQESWNYIARGVMKRGNHKFALEYVGSSATSARRFSEIQLFPGTVGTVTDFAYPRNTLTAAVYDRIFNQLVAGLPDFAARAAANPAIRGLPIAYRWRCVECGLREIDTETSTGRALLTAEGPLPWDGWTYDSGVSFGFSDATSTLGGGYYYRNTDAVAGIIGLRDVMKTGQVNPFLLPGESQSADGLRAIQSASARGVELATGRAEVKTFDFSVTGPLFKLPTGDVGAAFGVDVRQETYAYIGGTAKGFIEGAPFDTKPALSDVSRDIWAVYGELLVPVLENLELSLALRHDDYSGFGGTTNPKVTVKYRPIEPLMFRASYNTGFRVPTFGQLFDPASESPYLGSSIADPKSCANPLSPSLSITGCAPVTGLIQINGGKTDLGPEESEGYSFGLVFQPVNNFSASLDYWKIERSNTIQLFSFTQLVQNYALFEDRFLRNAAGQWVALDQRRVNSGGSITEGLELTLRGNGEVFGGKWTAGLDGSYLLNKKERPLPTTQFGSSLVGVFSFYGDLGLEWKHTLFGTFRKGDWTGSLSQIYRAGYTNQVLPGVANGLVNPPNDVANVKPYITYNASVTYTGFKNIGITAGVRNLFNEEAPFAISYNSGSGSGANWEPRVADARGRAFTLTLDYNF